MKPSSTRQSTAQNMDIGRAHRNRPMRRRQRRAVFSHSARLEQARTITSFASQVVVHERGSRGDHADHGGEMAGKSYPTL